MQGIVLDNITITTSPSWTLVSLISGHQSVLLCKQIRYEPAGAKQHFQYCNNVTVRHTSVFNANNGSIEAPNADGIDVHSSSNVHVHDSIFDVGDDALCCKSGADYLGREVS